MKTIFLFDETGEFKGTSIAQEHPFKPGEFLMPVMSTDIEPPTISEGQVGFFKDGAWSLVDDFRGKTWYDITTGDPVVITELGHPIASLAPTLPTAIQIKQARSEKVDEINWAAVVAITGGFSSKALGDANTYPSKSTDQQNTNSVSLVGGAMWCENAAGEWKFITHTKAQAAKVQADMVAHIQAQQQKCIDFLAKVDAAKTIVEIKVIVWA